MFAMLLACVLGQGEVVDEAFVERVIHPTGELIERAIRDLGAAEFGVREAASRYLWLCGPRAKVALQKAAQGGDFEVRTRAGQVLQAIEDRQIPKVADARLRGVVQCRMGNWREGLQSLMDAGALNLLNDLAKEPRSPVARGTVEQIHAEDLAQVSEEDKARLAAEAARGKARHDALEKRDWAALSKWSEGIEWGWLRGTTLRLAILKELGREAEAPAALEEVGARVAADTVMSGKAAGDLILAERPEDALALNMEYSRISAMRMLADDLRFREGFAAIGIGFPLREPELWMEKLWADQVGREPKRIHWAGRVWQAAFVAQTAARLGEQEIAERFMAKAVELAETNPDGNALATNWELELAIGQEERAWKHFAATLTDKTAEARNSALCWRHHEAAGAWWDFLRATRPDAPIEEFARTVMSVLDPKRSNAFSQEEVRNFVLNLRQHAAELGADGQVNALQAAAEAADLHRLTELAHEIWLEVEGLKPSGRSALALADFFAAKEAWNEAADWYGRAWSRDRTQLFTIVLQAKSLDKAARHDEAERARLLADLWPNGEDHERMGIPFLLQFRGQMSEAHEQYALARKLVQHPFDWPWIFMSQADHQAPATPAEAAESWNLVRMMCFDDSMILTGDEVKGLYAGHEELVQRVHHYRAMGKIGARDFDAALADGTVAEAAQPAGIVLALELVAKFDEAGGKEYGDRVFEKIWSRRKQVVDDFPKAAEFHEQLAVIGAAGRRKLDESLAHGERAVGLRPKRVSSLLAVARVHVARGEGDAARTRLAEALAIEPSSPDAARLQRELEASRRPADR